MFCHRRSRALLRIIVILGNKLNTDQNLNIVFVCVAQIWAKSMHKRPSHGHLRVHLLWDYVMEAALGKAASEADSAGSRRFVSVSRPRLRPIPS